MIAIGAAKVMGFQLMENFNTPYFAVGIRDFWGRWHISLSTWFREYVYIPLGGNRCSHPRHIFNLLVVWMLTGFWHGAQWNFLLWGLYYGILLILEKYIWGDFLKKLPNLLQHIYSLVFVLIGWVFFFSPSLKSAINYLKTMFYIGSNGIIDTTGIFLILTNWLLFTVCIFASVPFSYKFFKKKLILLKNDTLQHVVTYFIYIAMFLTCIAFLVTETYNPFLYFRF